MIKIFRITILYSQVWRHGETISTDFERVSGFDDTFKQLVAITHGGHIYLYIFRINYSIMDTHVWLECIKSHVPEAFIAARYTSMYSTAGLFQLQSCSIVLF